MRRRRRRRRQVAYESLLVPGLVLLVCLCLAGGLLLHFRKKRTEAQEASLAAETVAVETTVPETEAEPETEPQTQEETESPALHAWEVFPQNGRVLTAVNARAGAEGDSAIMAVLQEGETVTITGTDGVHYMVETEQGTGYVTRKYIIPELYLSGNHPPFEAPSLDGIDLERPMVALTFDDGPKAETTNRVLGTLEQNNARATFYLMGSNVYGENNDCVKKMLELHCEVGNHTYNHTYFNLQPLAEIRPSVREADYMIEETCGKMPGTVRPPGGGISDEASEELKTLGLPAIFWSIDTLDWQTKDPEKTYKAVMENVRDGDIILMHDVHPETVEAAVRIIPDLIQKGYQLVTVSELAAARGAVLEPGKSYREFWR